MMETIMSLVVEESDTLSVDLLSPILNVLKKGNKEILPIARQLGEKVIVKCPSKLTPCLLSAVRSSGTSLADYCKAVSDVCKAGYEAVEPTDGDAANKNVVGRWWARLVRVPVGVSNEMWSGSGGDWRREQWMKIMQLVVHGDPHTFIVATVGFFDCLVAMETLEDAPPSEEVGPRAVGSPITVMSNGNLDKDNDNTSEVAMETRENASPSEEVGSSTVEFPKTFTSNDVLDNGDVNTSQVAAVQLEDVPPSEEVGPRAVESPKTVMGSGILNKDNDNSSQVRMETPEDARHSEEVVPSAVAPLISVMSDGILDKDNDNPSELAMETVEDAPPSEEGVPSDVRSPKILMSDGILDKDNDNTCSANDNSKEADVDTQDGKVEPSNSSKIVADSVDTKESPKTNTKPEKLYKRKGKRSKSRKKPSKAVKPATSNRILEVTDTSEHQDIAKDIENRKIENPSAESADAVDTETSREAPFPSPKTSDNEHAHISLPSQSGSLADETCSKKAEGENKTEDETAVYNDAENNPDAKKETDTQLKKKATGSKSKLDKYTNKKALSASDQEENVPDTTDDSKKEEDNIDDLDSNSTHDSAQRAEAGVSQHAEKKKRGQAKLTPAKSKKKTQANEEKKKVAIPKSTPKVFKNESGGEDALKSSSKRKRPSKEKAPKTKDNGTELVGVTVKVWWPDDNAFYKGVVDSFDSATKKHKVLYDDGDVENLNLKEEKWQLVSPSEGDASDGDSPDESANEMPPKGKKPKTNADLDAKRGKTVNSAKKSGTASSKSKSTPKFVSKSDTSKTAGKSTEEVSKKFGKSDTAMNQKSTKSTKSGNKLFDDSPKSAKKSKDDNMDTTKSSSKSKQDTSKGASKSKGKTPKSVGKPSSGGSGSGKVKSGTLMDDEETEDESLEKPKGKSQSTPKSQKSSKKRKRSTKG
ncbi:hypothetical protein KSS87_004382 [Heliosperma pusillum]|nr:hypothetical protein KSS87_004382 [Heliosperma pusillum]